MADMNFGGSRNYNGANVGNSGGGFGGGNLGGGLAQLFGGMFGDSGSPYQAGQDAYQPYFNQATGAQQPYAQAGQQAIGKYQDWLQGQQDPTAFINHLMGGYQESPWAKYQQQQGIRALQNQGSNLGLIGSSPMQLQAQQNAQGISSHDMQNWLGNVLGINSNYGAGQQALIQSGQGAANALSGLYGQGADAMAGFGMREKAGENQDRNNIWGGLGNIGGGLLSHFGLGF